MFECFNEAIFCPTPWASWIARDSTQPCNREPFHQDFVVVKKVHGLGEPRTGCSVTEKVMIASNPNDPIEGFEEGVPNRSHVAGSSALVECRHRVKVARQKNSDSSVANAEVGHDFLGKERWQHFTK